MTQVACVCLFTCNCAKFVDQILTIGKGGFFEGIAGYKISERLIYGLFANQILQRDKPFKMSGRLGQRFPCLCLARFEI